MKLAILYGGKSGEHEVSILSASSIVRRLDPGHRLSLIGIGRDGVWYLQPDSMLAACREEDQDLQVRTDGPQVQVAPGRGLRVFGKFGMSELAIDVVFPALHGSYGEDGTVQGLLDCAGLAYVGADVCGSAMAMNKVMAKRLWQADGLPVVPFRSYSHSGWQEAGERAAEDCAAAFGWPLFIKPANAGSSVGTSKVLDEAGFRLAMESAFAYDSLVLVEPFIEAIEVECAVLGNHRPEAFIPGEVEPLSGHAFYDYDAKYLDPNGAALHIPARISQSDLEQAKDLALAAYRSLGLSGMARVDFFLDKKSGSLLLNEANTIPGFTAISLYPRMCAASGLPYNQLLESLLALAIERQEERRALRYSLD